MSREFEVAREIDLPAAPGRRLDRDHRRPRRVACSRPGMEIPRRRRAAGGRAGHDVGPAEPPRHPHGVARRHVQRARVHDRGPRRRHGAPALRPQRDPRRRLGGPVRRDRRAHRLLPAHARPVPRALQRPPRDLRRPAVVGHRGPAGRGRRRTRWTRCARRSASATARRSATRSTPTSAARARSTASSTTSRRSSSASAPTTGSVRFFGRNALRQRGRHERPRVPRRRRRGARRGGAEGLAGHRLRLVPAPPPPDALGPPGQHAETGGPSAPAPRQAPGRAASRAAAAPGARCSERRGRRARETP